MTCARCNVTRCECPDYIWSGGAFPRRATIVIDQTSEPGAWDRFFRQVHGEPGQHDRWSIEQVPA